MRWGDSGTDHKSMTIGFLSSAPTEADLPTVVLPSVIPNQRVSPDPDDVPSVAKAVPDEVLGELRHISECYRACRAKADALRTRQPSGADKDRDVRHDLMRTLQHLHELRERRSALLDAHDLPSTAGSMR